MHSVETNSPRVEHKYIHTTYTTQIYLDTMKAALINAFTPPIPLRPTHNETRPYLCYTVSMSSLLLPSSFRASPSLAASST